MTSAASPGVPLPGFASPVDGAQAVFRLALEAMARPGRLYRLSPEALAGLAWPGVSPALAATMLALLDADVTAWVDPSLGNGDLPATLRFHTGVRRVGDAAQADFLVMQARTAGAWVWREATCGTDEAPQAGATVLIDLPSWQGPLATLRGPGIRGRESLSLGTLSPAFWAGRAELEVRYPAGVDLLLCGGDLIAGVPRTTLVTWDPDERGDD